jgi:hypothetical protein
VSGEAGSLDAELIEEPSAGLDGSEGEEEEGAGGERGAVFDCGLGTAGGDGGGGGRAGDPCRDEGGCGGGGDGGSGSAKKGAASGAGDGLGHWFDYGAEGGLRGGVRAVADSRQLGCGGAGRCV